MNELFEASTMDVGLINYAGFTELLVRFFFNLLMVTLVIRFFYYPKSRRRDYYFTFTLISISIFLMIFYWEMLSSKWVLL